MHVTCSLTWNWTISFHSVVCILDALRLLLGPFLDKSSSSYYFIQFLGALYAFAKPADFKFPREKVGNTVGEVTFIEGQPPDVAIYLRTYLRASFLTAAWTVYARAFGAGPLGTTRIAGTRLIWWKCINFNTLAFINRQLNSQWVCKRSSYLTNLKALACLWCKCRPIGWKGDCWNVLLDS